MKRSKGAVLEAQSEEEIFARLYAGPVPADPYVREAGRALYCAEQAASGLEHLARLLGAHAALTEELVSVLDGVRAWQTLAAEHARGAARARQRRGAA